MESPLCQKERRTDREPDWSAGFRPGDLRGNGGYEPGRRPALQFLESAHWLDARVARRNPLT